MNRRALLAGAALAALGPSTRGSAQPRAPRRLGVLTTTQEGDPEWAAERAALLVRLRDLGWSAGENLQVEFRFGLGEFDRLAAGARELVQGGSEVVVARSSRAVTALLDETRTVPIVFVSVADPVGERFAASFARPGGIATGFTNFEAAMAGKWLELLKEVAPRVRRAAVLYNPASAVGGGAFFISPMERAVGILGMTLVPTPVGTVAATVAAVERLAGGPDAALVVPPDIFTVANRATIVELAARHRLPAIYTFRNFTTEGGLMSYGVNVADLYRRSADYVDRILKGAAPADLPIQGPVHFDLAINLKTARGLGLTIPPSLLARADEVIE